MTGSGDRVSRALDEVKDEVASQYDDEELAHAACAGADMMANRWDSCDSPNDWKVMGTAHKCGLGGLPDIVLDMKETVRYAVFADGEALLMVPDDQVEP